MKKAHDYYKANKWLVATVATAALFASGPVNDLFYSPVAKASTGDYSSNFNFNAGDKVDDNQGPGDSHANSIAKSAQNSMAQQLSQYGNSASHYGDQIALAIQGAYKEYHKMNSQIRHRKAAVKSYKAINRYASLASSQAAQISSVTSSALDEAVYSDSLVADVKSQSGQLSKQVNLLKGHAKQLRLVIKKDIHRH